MGGSGILVVAYRGRHHRQGRAGVRKDCKITRWLHIVSAPWDFAPQSLALASELDAELAGLEKAAGSVFDLGPAVKAVKRLVDVAGDLTKR